MKTKKQFIAPEITIMGLDMQTSILAGSMAVGGESSATIQSLSEATFNWSSGSLS